MHKTLSKECLTEVSVDKYK